MNIFLNINQLVIQYIKKKGWEEIKYDYIKEGKEKIFLNKNNLKKITNEKILKLLSSYRKKLINKLINTNILLINEKEYLPFLGNNKIENIIQKKVFGSTNITSDYDLILSGPGTYKILKCIIEHLHNKINKDLSYLFDVNIYLLPVIIINDYNKEIFNNYNIDFFNPLNLNTINNTFSYSIPLPNKYNIIKLEYNSLKEKKNNKLINNLSIFKRYTKLIIESEKLDNFIYKKDNSIIKSANDFYKTFFLINKYSIQGYYTLSSYLIIIYEIYLKNTKVFSILQPVNYIIACYENILDFIHYFTNYFNKYDFTNILYNQEYEYKNNIELIQVVLLVSKYIYRIYYFLYQFLNKNKELNINFNNKLIYSKDINNKFLFLKKIIKHKSKNINTLKENNIYFKEIILYIDMFYLNKKYNEDDTNNPINIINNFCKNYLKNYINSNKKTHKKLIKNS